MCLRVLKNKMCYKTKETLSSTGFFVVTKSCKTVTLVMFPVWGDGMRTFMVGEISLPVKTCTREHFINCCFDLSLLVSMSNPHVALIFC